MKKTLKKYKVEMNKRIGLWYGKKRKIVDTNSQYPSVMRFEVFLAIGTGEKA
jgi:hypothetical protein